MACSVVAGNSDNHIKNIAFLMDKQGAWFLAPAFDVNYSYNPAGRRMTNGCVDALDAMPPAAARGTCVMGSRLRGNDGVVCSQ